MLHDISIEGLAFRLRPVNDGDAKFLADLRNNPDLNQYLHSGATSEKEQREWFSEYYKRKGDYYFMVERKINGSPEGVISLYDLKDKAAEWGRWIISPKSVAAVESSWLIYKVAFEQLNLNRVYCRTVAENMKVVSFHDSCGITDREVLPGHFNLNGKMYDAVEHRVSKESWVEISSYLEKMAGLLARRVNG